MITVEKTGVVIAIYIRFLFLSYAKNTILSAISLSCKRINVIKYNIKSIAVFNVSASIKLTLISSPCVTYCISAFRLHLRLVLKLNCRCNSVCFADDLKDVIIPQYTVYAAKPFRWKLIFAINKSFTY